MALAQPVFQVKDINTDRPRGDSLFGAELAQLGIHTVFTAWDSIHGMELWITDGTSGGTRILEDICPGICSSTPSGLTVVGSQLLFVADDGAHGRELWSSDFAGTSARMVADLTPGLPGTPVSSLIEHQGALLFVATDPAHGTELWKSDGTAAGTTLLADIQPGLGSSMPAFWTAMGTSLLLLADDGTHGRELWKTDGTAAGTVLVKDTNPGTSSGFPTTDPFAAYSRIFTPASAQLYFLAYTGLWITDGTEVGTVLVKSFFGFSGAHPISMCFTNGKLFFATAGELWTSDGTEEGTVPIRFFGDGGPYHLTALGDEAFFVAYQPPVGFDPYDLFELWKTDGTFEGTSVVRNIGPGNAGGLTPDSPLTVFGGKLLFWADDGVHGLEPWTSDGTEAGTTLLADLFPSGGSRPGVLDDLLIAGNSLYVHLMESDLSATHLWTTDGTPAGTRRVRRTARQASAFEPHPRGTLPGPRPMSDLNGSLIFQAQDSAGYGLWRTDGTAAGTAALAPFSNPPRELTSLGNLLVFAGEANGQAWTWATDGTPAGTTTLSPGPAGGPVILPTWLTRLGETVIFLGFRGFHFNTALWRTDGTQAGTTYIQGGLPEALTALGSSLLLRDYAITDLVIEQIPHGIELKKTDGVSAPVLVKDIQPGTGGSRPSQLIAVGDFVLFSADDGAAGRELWRTDATEAGTVLVKDIRAGAGSGIRLSYDRRDLPDELWAAVGSTVFFPADDGAAGEELWKSDGTEAGTVLVKDIFPGSRSSDIRWLTTVGNLVYFVAGDGVHGRELWMSDGTGAGTRMVMDISSGPDSSRPQELTALGDVLLFSATNGEGRHGREPWRTDGSTLGTRRIQDIAPGAASSSPMGFTASGPNVYFAANDSFSGFELWGVSKLSLLSSFGDVSSDYWAWNFIEALASAGITTGCAPGLYCPLSPVSRAEMAVFLERGIHGGSYTPPPATGTVFTDVLFDHWAAAWIEQLAADGITTGCAPDRYCPEAPVNRAEMAVFLLRAKYGAAYTPPPATGALFTDVPASYWAAAWIEQLAAEGITTGCAPNQYCPDNSVSRDQMAAFLTRTFALPLP